MYILRSPYTALSFICLSVFVTMTNTTPGTAAAGLQQNLQTGNYAAAGSDCGLRIVFDVATQVTLKLNDAHEYPAECDITISNVGKYTGPGSARGAILSISGLALPNQGNVLYPGQTTIFSKVAEKWFETGYAQRQLWKPSVSATFYVDCSAGSDEASDGLGPGPGANRTLAQSFVRLSNFVDYSGGASQARWSTNGNCRAGDGLHMAGALRGGQGGAAFKWDGNGTTTVNAAGGTSCAALFFHAEIEILNVKCQSADASGCFAASSGAVILFAAPASTCNPGTGQGFVADDPGSKIYFVDTGFNFGAQTGVASAAAVFSAQNGGIIAFEHAETIKFLSDVKFSEANLVTANLGGILLSGTKFDTGGFVITGLRFFCEGFSVLGAGSSPNKVIPGSVDGIIESDCKMF